MNKLLLLALLGCVLIAVTAANDQQSGQSLSEHMEIRQVREADPGNKKKEKKRNPKKKSKKTDKKRKSKQSRKVGKKEKKVKRKDSRKSKGGKKGGKIKKVKKIKSKGRKHSKSGKPRQGETCGDDACLANACKYMKQLKDKVTNFLKQKKRIEKFLKLSKNKGAKNANFKNTLAQLKESGGGNSSALTCQGSSSSQGAKNLQELVGKLDACEASINTSCLAPPAFDTALAANLETIINNFKISVEACQKLSGAPACSCWNGVELATLSASLVDCDLSANNTAIKEFKVACTNSFSDCRTEGAKASDVLSACSAKNSPGALLAQLKSASANKNALTALRDTANSKATRKTRSRRSFRAATCAAFTVSVGNIAKMAAEKPDSGDLAAKAEAVNKDAPDSCTADEKASLKNVVANMDESIAVIATFIETTQSNLLVQTGSTASSSVIDSATKPAAATTPSTPVTTKAPGRRSKIVII